MQEIVTYACGFKTRDAAEECLEDGFATGDVVWGERPEIVGYHVVNAEGRRLRRFKITLRYEW